MIDFSLIESDTEKVEFLNNMNHLVENGECTPELINTAMANYASTSSWLISMLEITDTELHTLEMEYEIWESEKLVETKLKLQEGLAKSLKLSQGEINSQMIVDNKVDYKSWKFKLQMAERRADFYHRLVDMWKKNSDHILGLANNMRQELRSLSIQTKANKKIDSEMTMRKVKKVKLYD